MENAECALVDIPQEAHTILTKPSKLRQQWFPQLWPGHFGN